MAEDQIDAIIEALETVSERVVIAISTSFVANMQAQPQAGGTPRETGWAAANWSVAIGERPSVTRADLEADQDQRNVAAARADSERTIAVLQTSYTLNQGKVFAFNPVPYIVKLNSGSSSQAPSGFVQRGINKAITSDLVRLIQS